MSTSANDNMPWDGDEQAKAGSAAATSPRSSLNLDGSRSPQAAGATFRDTRELWTEGATRARDMAHALMMIVVLLAKYVAVKLVWARLQTGGTRLFVLGSRLLQALYVVVKPHLERLKEQARSTSNALWRAALIKLIQVLGPVEEAALRMFGVAQVEAAKLAARSTRSIGQVLASLGQAIAQAIQAGLSKPTVQKLAAKVIKILEDAHL